MISQERGWHELLTETRKFRDAVHGDIWLTDFESEIMDTIPFQKLRHIRQLGFTYIVYPSAHHTRFEHSLGAVYIAEKIMNTVQKNYQAREKISQNFEEKLEKAGSNFHSISPRDRVMTRTVALLHDAAHLPFGHTLEKEGNIFATSQWADKRRLDYFFKECKKMDFR